jgi:hypothetical protein
MAGNPVDQFLLNYIRRTVTILYFLYSPATLHISSSNSSALFPGFFCCWSVVNSSRCGSWDETFIVRNRYMEEFIWEWDASKLRKVKEKKSARQLSPTFGAMRCSNSKAWATVISE